MTDRIIAVDPGNMSGVAYGVFFPRRGVVAYEMDQMNTCNAVGAMLDEDLTSLVVCESFTPRPGVRTWQPAAIEIIGTLRYLCWRTNTPFELQSPADAKRFATNDKLKQLGWWNPSKDGHANDAYRHLLLAAVRGGALDPGVFV